MVHLYEKNSPYSRLPPAASASTVLLSMLCDAPGFRSVPILMLALVSCTGPFLAQRLSHPSRWCFISRKYVGVASGSCNKPETVKIRYLRKDPVGEGSNPSDAPLIAPGRCCQGPSIAASPENDFKCRTFISFQTWTSALTLHDT